MDTDRTQANRVLDTIYIDEMYFLSSSGAAQSGDDETDLFTDWLAPDLALMLVE